MLRPPTLFPLRSFWGWMTRLEIFGSLPKDARSTRVRGIRWWSRDSFSQRYQGAGDRNDVDQQMIIVGQCWWSWPRGWWSWPRSWWSWPMCWWSWPTNKEVRGVRPQTNGFLTTGKCRVSQTSTSSQSSSSSSSSSLKSYLSPSKVQGGGKVWKRSQGENMEVCESMEKEKLRWIGIKRRATQPAFSTFNLNDSTSSSTHSV